MVSLLPLPDELDQGYLGRLMRLNGLRSASGIVKLLAQWADVPPPSRDGVCCLELLAQAANMEIPQFVCRHTTLPFRRSITSYLPDLAHGSTESQSMLRMTGMRVARRGAYFCICCVKSDHESYGMSYWRRDHQLPGVALCAKHLRPLRYVDSNEAFLEAPSIFVDQSHVVSEVWASLNQAHPGIRLFLAISRELLDGNKPIDVKIARIVLRDLASERGWCTYNAKKGKNIKPLLSDQVLMKFPRDWLLTVFPVLADKEPGIKLDQMDGVLYLSTSASSVTPYILACCLLFDSAEEALRALRATDIAAPEPRNRSAPMLRPADELRAAYIRAQGQYALIASEMAGDSRSSLNQIEAMGLPNLSGRGRQSALVAATEFFINKKSVAESASLGGVTSEVLENLIRQSGSELAAALTDMNAPQRGSSTGVLRVKPRTPFEAGTTVVQATEEHSDLQTPELAIDA